MGYLYLFTYLWRQIPCGLYRYILIVHCQLYVKMYMVAVTAYKVKSESQSHLVLSQILPTAACFPPALLTPQTTVAISCKGILQFFLVFSLLYLFLVFL